MSNQKFPMMKVSLSVTSIFIILYSIFCGSKKTLKSDFFKNAMMLDLIIIRKFCVIQRFFFPSPFSASGCIDVTFFFERFNRHPALII